LIAIMQILTHTALDMTTGEAIKALREAARVSQRTLAQVAGISPTTVKAAESLGDEMPRRTTWVAMRGSLAELLQVEEDSLDAYVLMHSKSIRMAEEIAASDVDSMVRGFGKPSMRVQFVQKLIGVCEGTRWPLGVLLAMSKVPADRAPRLIASPEAAGAEDVAAVYLASRSQIRSSLAVLARRAAKAESKIRNFPGDFQQALKKTVEDWTRHLADAAAGSPQSPARPYTITDADASRAEPGMIGHNIPLRTLVAAGPGGDHADRIFADKYLPSALVPHPEWGLGAFQVTGDSMAPYFLEGDIVIIGERLKRVRTGDILIVGFKNGEHTVKKLRVIDEDTWELQPVNPNHPTMRVKVEEEVSWYTPVLARIEPIWRRRAVPWEKDLV
jgi:SOS-response transcriptional repressor LexA/transcriptional regulator with XRE-family HTH domain